jgi:hypothetical protein
MYAYQVVISRHTHVHSSHSSPLPLKPNDATTTDTISSFTLTHTDIDTSDSNNTNDAVDTTPSCLDTQCSFSRKRHNGDNRRRAAAESNVKTGAHAKKTSTTSANKKASQYEAHRAFAAPDPVLLESGMSINHTSVYSISAAVPKSSKNKQSSAPTKKVGKDQSTQSSTVTCHGAECGDKDNDEGSIDNESISHENEGHRTFEASAQSVLSPATGTNTTTVLNLTVTDYHVHNTTKPEPATNAMYNRIDDCRNCIRIRCGSNETDCIEGEHHVFQAPMAKLLQEEGLVANQTTLLHPNAIVVNPSHV